MFNMTNIGKKISNLRKEKNLTQVELADRLGVTYQAVSNWERGDSMPDIAKLSDLAEVFEISIDELLGHSKQTVIIQDILEDKKVAVKDLDEETIEDVLPLVKPDQVEKNVDYSGVTFDQLLSIAPFLNEEILDGIVQELIDEIKIRDIVRIAPFLATETVNQIVLSNYQKEDFNVRDIAGFMPFVDENVVDLLATQLDPKDLAPLAPFMSSEVLSEIVQTAIQEGRLKDVMALIPFTDLSFFNKSNVKNIFKKG